MTGDSFQTTTEELRWVQGSCIRCNAIDTWLKLYTLLWLYEHSDQRLSCLELCERLYQNDDGLMRAILAELNQAGFLIEANRQFWLSDAPDVTACLSYLDQNFADPLARQRLIERIRVVEPDRWGRGHGF